MNTTTNLKQYLSKRWSLRHEPSLHNAYSLFDLYNGTHYNINRSIYNVLSCLSLGATSKEVGKTFHLDEESASDLVEKLSKRWPSIFTTEIDNAAKPQPMLGQIVPKNFRVPVYSFPISTEIHLTEKCNLCCRHCVCSCSSSSKCEIIPAKIWIAFLKQLEEQGLWNVTLTGGEVCMHPEFDAIAERLHELNLHFYVLTNAMLMTPFRAKCLSAPNISLMVSLDGSKADTHNFLRGKGAFETLVPNVDLLAEAGGNICLSVTVNKQNFKDINNIVHFAEDHGCYGVTFIALDNHGRAKDNLALSLSNDMLEEARKTVLQCKGEHKNLLIQFFDPSCGIDWNLTNKGTDTPVYCTGGTSHFAVASNGDIYPCVYAFGIDELKVENITHEGFTHDIWMNPMWDIMRAGPTLSEIKGCGACRLNSHCSLKNCRVRAKKYQNDFLGKPDCRESTVS